MTIEEKFKNGDIIVCNGCKDMAVYDKVDKKGYMHFKKYYCRMKQTFIDVKKYTLQINYQKFWHVATDDEEEKFKGFEKDEKEQKNTDKRELEKTPE